MNLHSSHFIGLTCQYVCKRIKENLRLRITLIVVLLGWSFYTNTLERVSTVIAGGGVGDGGNATNPRKFPAGIDIDKSGILTIADYGNDQVRMVDNNGIITTVVGSGGFVCNESYNVHIDHYQVQGTSIDSAGNLKVGVSADQWAAFYKNTEPAG